MPAVPLILCIGHITLDLVTLLDAPPGDDEQAHARDAVLAGGGPAATAAVAASRLGVRCALLGTVGDDDAGELALAGLRREGVDISGVRVGAGPTAMSSIWVDAATGHRRIAAHYRDAGIDSLTDHDLDLARSAAWIHLDTPGFVAARMLRDARIATPISLDAGNPITGLDLHIIDLYAPTEARLLECHGTTPETAIAAALAEGPSMVVATRGSNGSIGSRMPPRAAAGDERHLEVLVSVGFSVPVVSTLGAGDVFHGALLAGLARGLDLGPAMTLANATAALSCRGLDGRSAIPGWDEALAFAAAGGRAIETTGAPA